MVSEESNSVIGNVGLGLNLTALAGSAGHRSGRISGRIRMFSKPTVFIIGAGASAEFGMPVGSKLMQNINALISGETFFGHITNQLGPIRSNRYREVRGELLRAIAKFKSMDTLLHYHGEDHELVELGKLAIAHEILQAERRSALRSVVDGEVTNLHVVEASWANIFLEMAVDGSQSSGIGDIFANVTIVDFNYDRVLPQYLRWALEKYFGLEYGFAASVVRHLRFLHPYGSLGPLVDSVVREPVRFGNVDANLEQIANRIKTYTEENSDPQSREIKECLADADLIVVLGFGYHMQNMRMIELPGQRRAPVVFATMHGMGEHNFSELASDLGRKLQTGTILHFNMTGKVMMRELAPSIARAASQ
jgi:hypothetical protein